MSFLDRDNTIHQVEVEAESLYEAAVRGIRELRNDHWSNEGSYWTGCFEIVIRAPEVKHRVLAKDLQSFLERTGGIPREITARHKLKEVLNGSDRS